MTVEQMKGHLMARYPGSAWAEKVRKMGDKQVIAIYARCANAGLVPKYKKDPPPENYEYRCPDCEVTFIASNPDFEECPKCGGRNIYRYRLAVKQKLERIIKEQCNED